jgi:hypothetical protein
MLRAQRGPGVGDIRWRRAATQIGIDTGRRPEDILNGRGLLSAQRVADRPQDHVLHLCATQDALLDTEQHLNDHQRRSPRRLTCPPSETADAVNSQRRWSVSGSATTAVRHRTCPPSSDPPRGKKPAKPRSARQRSGRKPGKQPGGPGVSRSLSDNPDRIMAIEPDRCGGCQGSLAAATCRRDRTAAGGCGTVNTADWAGADPEHAAVVGHQGHRSGSGPAPWPCACC